MTDYEATCQLLNKMELTVASQVLATHLEEATKDKKQTYLGFLHKLLIAEDDARQREKLKERLEQSQLPPRKTLDEFDFDFQPSIDRKQIEELATLAFLEKSKNVLFLGPPGVGKTHLAIALGYRTIESGKTVFFTNLGKMAADLKKVKNKPTAKRWNTYVDPSLLIVDEVGYSQLDSDAGGVFFEVISRRYESGSTILTSNKHFTEWGEVISDTTMAVAALDRLLHHVYVINIRGSSFRLKNYETTT